MGWYAWYKWYSSFSKKECIDRIYWYKEFILKTPEQREEDKRNVRTLLISLAMMSSMLEEKKV